MKATKKRKIVLALTAVAVAVVFFFAGFGTGYFVGKGADDAPAAPSEPAAGGENGGLLLTADEDEAEDRGISLTKAELPLGTMSAEEREEYGIMPIAESAYTVTATVSGEGLSEEQKGVTWSAPAFKDPSSEWATGKNVTDYVTISPSGNQVTVSCLKDFGEQIVITASSSYNHAVQASFTCDYQRKFGAYLDIWYPEGCRETPIYSMRVFKETGTDLPTSFEWYHHYCFAVGPLVTAGTVGDLDLNGGSPPVGTAEIAIDASTKSVFESRWGRDVSDCGTFTPALIGYAEVTYPSTSFGDAALAKVFGSSAIDHYGSDLRYFLGTKEDELRYYFIGFDISLHVREGNLEGTFVIRCRLDRPSLANYSTYVD